MTTYQDQAFYRIVIDSHPDQHKDSYEYRSLEELTYRMYSSVSHMKGAITSATRRSKRWDERAGRIFPPIEYHFERAVLEWRDYERSSRN